MHMHVSKKEISKNMYFRKKFLCWEMNEWKASGSTTFSPTRDTILAVTFDFELCIDTISERSPGWESALGSHHCCQTLHYHREGAMPRGDPCLVRVELQYGRPSSPDSCCQKPQDASYSSFPEGLAFIFTPALQMFCFRLHPCLTDALLPRSPCLHFHPCLTDARSHSYSFPCWEVLAGTRLPKDALPHLF